MSDKLQAERERFEAWQCERGWKRPDARLYRKTALVSAEQFLPDEWKIPAGVISDGNGDPRKDSAYSFVLDTKEGRHTLRNGDYICTGPAGEKWNVERAIFEATYELADTPTAPEPSAPADKVDADELARLRALINSPELRDFAKGVTLEAIHQREKWGTDHDAGKTAADWFWLIGYLAQKAMMHQLAGETDKALHHTITTASACANWHAAISGTDTSMRPGIDGTAIDAAMTSMRSESGEGGKL